MEYHDTMDAQTITHFIVRHVEAFLGYTSTSAEFVRSCHQLPEGDARRR
jgi:hypothetical protein